MVDRPSNVISLQSDINRQAANEKPGDGELFQGLKNKLPAAPDGLGQIAMNTWVFIGKQLEQAGIITSVDLSVFRRYCETYELYVEAQREVKANGEFQETPNGYVQLSPWSVARERHSSTLKTLEDKLFLNPSARRRVKFENPNQGELEL